LLPLPRPHFTVPKCISGNLDNRTGLAFDDCCKRLLKFVIAATLNDNELTAERTGRRN
jgi:hypothetical protein